ncbi:hypothetical protein EDB85DRAFT_1926273 [Lactarius pseudohatsudake]|nr:hypothetical protein EDB85DRAFT_1926273 [Lactarius pseudohatsudake]
MWIERMKLIVKELHDNGYVHGGLRLPNFIVDGERLLLVDFDWGGKSGEATFPNTRLRPILRSDQRETLITRERDEEVLGNTIKNIKGLCA